MKKYLLDEILPKYRNKEMGIPEWAYQAAEQLASYELKNSNGMFFTTPAGLSCSGHEAKAATFAVIMAETMLKIKKN